jgi:hypothetical protein
MCISIYCMYINIYIHICTYLHIHICKYIDMHIQVHIFLYICIDIFTNICIYKRLNREIFLSQVRQYLVKYVLGKNSILRLVYDFGICTMLCYYYKIWLIQIKCIHRWDQYIYIFVYLYTYLYTFCNFF